MVLWQIALNLSGIGLEILGFILIFKSQGRPDFSGGMLPGKAADQIKVVTKKTLNKFAVACIVVGLGFQGLGTISQLAET